jgi:1,2-dihydroxy-3-keto-5-methylthiopentene dioxygenase
MTVLTVYDAQTAQQVQQSTDPGAIAQVLAQHGVLFARWPVYSHIGKDTDPATIATAYAEEIACIKQQFAMVTADVIAMQPAAPQREALRQKFLQEHTHSEDEIRFFVDGQGLFSMHVDAGLVLVLLCCRGDLISVPKGMRHWFDMGAAPHFTCIRFFQEPAGWIATYSGSAIAAQFPTL